MLKASSLFTFVKMEIGKAFQTLSSLIDPFPILIVLTLKQIDRHLLLPLLSLFSKIIKITFVKLRTCDKRPPPSHEAVKFITHSLKINKRVQ